MGVLWLEQKDNNTHEEKIQICPCQAINPQKEDEIMATIPRNYIYEVSSVRDSKKEEPTVSKELLDKFKALADKYLTK